MNGHDQADKAVFSVNTAYSRENLTRPHLRLTLCDRGLKRKRSETQSLQTQHGKSFIQRFKEAAMTIVGNIVPEWDYFHSWGRGYNCDRWREPYRPECRPREDRGVIQIPIQIVGRNDNHEPSGCWEEWSDSDSEDFDINNSSSKMRRKRQRGQSALKLISSDDSLLNAAISKHDEEEEEELRRKEQRNRSHDETRSRYNTRSSGIGISEPLLIRSDSEELLEREINQTSSYSVYEYLKAFLSSTGRQIDAIKGDGNCFFRALSKIIYGNQSYYDEVRQAVVDVLKKYPKKFEAFADGPISQHIEDMRQDKTWATQTEIYAAATLFNRDIYILSPDQTGETYRWLLFQPQAKYNSDFTGCRCYITICHTHGNHYDRIAPIHGKCNCDLEPPEMTGVKGQVDLTSEDEIV